MKLMGSEGRVRAAGNRPPRPVMVADRPTFSLAMAVPVEWEMLTPPPDAALLDRLARDNAIVIGMLLKSADLGTAPIDDPVLNDALEPLRVKLDMIVAMLARLAYRDGTLPATRPIELSLGRLSWTQGAPLALDTWLISRVYLSDLLRDAIALAGRVTSCSPAPGVGQWTVEVALAEMADELGESFARLVFLEHRRQLAQHAAPAAGSHR
ncbi:MAG TPA: PilZ domain-containing protein [Stellaceae bacterium]